MGCDICYTNHAEADQDDMDNLLTLLVASGVNYIMGIPGADDIMLNYQSTSYHDALYARKLLGKKHAPEFAEWLQNIQHPSRGTDIRACCLQAGMADRDGLRTRSKRYGTKG